LSCVGPFLLRDPWKGYFGSVGFSCFIFPVASSDQFVYWGVAIVL
jgi:hypothetical protein